MAEVTVLIPPCGGSGEPEHDTQPLSALPKVVPDGALVQSDVPGDLGGRITEDEPQHDHLELPARQIGDRRIQAGRGLHHLQLVPGRTQRLGDRPVDDEGRGPAVLVELLAHDPAHDGPGALVDVPRAQQLVPTAQDLQEDLVYDLLHRLTAAEMDLGVSVEGLLVSEVEGFEVEREIEQDVVGLGRLTVGERRRSIVLDGLVGHTGLPVSLAIAVPRH